LVFWQNIFLYHVDNADLWQPENNGIFARINEFLTMITTEFCHAPSKQFFASHDDLFGSGRTVHVDALGELGGPAAIRAAALCHPSQG
jgi:hypothetical protein